MAVYTVHEPPSKRYESAADPERFAFVRDGFSFSAFLLAPLWMLRHRMWLVLLGYVAVVVTLERIGLTGTVGVLVGLLLALLIGFEASTLRRFTLARRKWRNIGIIVGDDLESAERRFFDAWVRNDDSHFAAPPPPSPPPPPGSASSAPYLRPQPTDSDVIGLFPQPGVQR